MKKFLFLALSVMISIISYADTFSCKVPGYDSEVKVVQRSYNSNSIGSLIIELSCTKPLGSQTAGFKNVTVLINIYDGVTKKFVTSVNGSVSGVTGKGNANASGLEKNHPYIVKIDYVSCDR
ncbi:MAG: hypothetical protein HDS07_07050 [Bacteroides sp.]|nr:hypothetical protein [Bacteroides sp.]